MSKKKPRPADTLIPTADYDGLLGDVVSLVNTARRTSAQAVNAVMTATYWEIGRRIVEAEQRGEGRAEYGQQLLKRLAGDLTARFGRGFSDRSLYKMRLFYLSHAEISPTLSAKSGTEISSTLSAKSFDQAGPILQTPSREFDSPMLPTVSARLRLPHETAYAAIERLAQLFPLPWSHYVKLLAVRDEHARQFYVT